MPDLIRKAKIYLDTSVLSYLKQDDSPERTAVTLKFWEELKTAKILIYIFQMLLLPKYPNVSNQNVLLCKVN